MDKHAAPAQFLYSNHMQRPVNGWLRAASIVHPGLHTMRAQIWSYADDWMKANQESAVSNEPLWIVMGDSLAQGVGASSHDKGWPGQLQTILQHNGYQYRLVNLSVSGARIHDMLDYQLPAIQALGRPSLITVLIGANDLFLKKHRRRLPEAVIDMLKQLPPGTVIGTVPLKREAAHDANLLLREASARYGHILADISELFAGPYKSKMANDRIHPNDHGYAEIARTFAEAISANAQRD